MAGIVERRGSHLLVSEKGRFAVVERRNGEIYGLRWEKRRGFPESSDGIRAAVGQDWTDEASARRQFDEIAARGETLARRLW